ncbi:MAG: hypothetical protein ACKVG9_09855, partial [Rhodospirillales bacterium]
GDYKLVRNYNHKHHQKTPELELYHLYQTEGRTQTRVDIEEAKNLVPHAPERTKDMNNRLTQVLTEMNASYPYFNRHCRLIGAE